MKGHLRLQDSEWFISNFKNIFLKVLLDFHNEPENTFYYLVLSLTVSRLKKLAKDLTFDVSFLFLLLLPLLIHELSCSLLQKATPWNARFLLHFTKFFRVLQFVISILFMCLLILQFTVLLMVRKFDTVRRQSTAGYPPNLSGNLHL